MSAGAADASTDAGADSVSAEAGETTALLAICNGAEVWGASAGDSAAFVLEAGALRELTAEQQRRPFVGSGQAEPRPFGPVPLSGPLLVCSDGLHKYCARDVIARQLAQLADGTVDVRGCVDALVEAARVGATADWHDDVAVIVAVVDAQKSAPTT